MGENLNIEEKYKELLLFFGDSRTVSPSIYVLKQIRWIPEMFKKGTKCWLNLEKFKESYAVKEWANQFEDNWQPITITYKRGGVMYVKFDDYPKVKEFHFDEDGWNLFTQNIYLRKIYYSEFFKKKIKKLKDKNIDELKLQVSLFEFDDKNGKVEIVKDVENYLIN